MEAEGGSRPLGQGAGTAQREAGGVRKQAIKPGSVRRDINFCLEVPNTIFWLGYL